LKSIARLIFALLPFPSFAGVSERQWWLKSRMARHRWPKPNLFGYVRARHMGAAIEFKAARQSE